MTLQIILKSCKNNLEKLFKQLSVSGKSLKSDEIEVEKNSNRSKNSQDILK